MMLMLMLVQLVRMNRRLLQLLLLQLQMMRMGMRIHHVRVGVRRARNALLVLQRQHWHVRARLGRIELRRHKVLVGGMALGPGVWRVMQLVMQVVICEGTVEGILFLQYFVLLNSWKLCLV